MTSYKFRLQFLCGLTLDLPVVIEGISMFKVLLQKFILELLWFVHNLQFWLMVSEEKLKNRSVADISDDSCGEDPFYLVKKGSISLLCLVYLRVARFCFRFSQLAYYSILCVYIYLGFKEPVPLAIVKILKKSN